MPHYTLTYPRAKFIPVPMAAFHSVLYNALRLDAIRVIDRALSGECNHQTAVRSIARLSSAATLPRETLFEVLGGVGGALVALKDLVEEVAAEGVSNKLMTACSMVRTAAAADRKIVIWSVLTEAIAGLAELLADMEPITVFRTTEPAVRANLFRQFHESASRVILVADPRVCPKRTDFLELCREAIYLDRSYNIEQYSRSVRAVCGGGSPSEVQTRVRVLQAANWQAVGSIDHSIGIQLLRKIGTNAPVHGYGVTPEDLPCIQHHLSREISPPLNEQI
jgi:hypothetical protein